MNMTLPGRASDAGPDHDPETGCTQEEMGEQIKDLVALEEVLSILDQHARANGSNPQRAYSRMYAELAKMRDAELSGWNYDLGDAHHFRLHRCDEAAKPYHTTDFDGPCEVYTTHSSKGAHLCQLHELLAIEAAEQEAEALHNYRMAKQRGEDI